jgi:hypothetical protein
MHIVFRIRSPESRGTRGTGRGNPTLFALGRLASALGMKLAVSLVPADGGLEAAPGAATELPGTLVRLRRTAEFWRATEAMARGLGLEHGDFSIRLTGALAKLAAALGIEPSEADWWRLVDALLLVATVPRN